MLKTFKEYMSYLGGFRIGNLDAYQPIDSLGDLPPKGQGGRDSRGVGLNASDKNPNDKDSKQIQKKNIKKEDGMTGPGLGTYNAIADISTKKIKKELKENFKVDDDVYVKNKKSLGKGTIFKIIRPHTDRKEPEYEVKWSYSSVITVGRYTKQELIKADFQLEDTNRVPRKPGQPAGSDKHSDLYTDENPKGTIQGLGFTDAETATTSVNKIKNSGKSHAHKIQAAIAMSQRAKVASERAKDPKKKKDLAAAHRIYQSFIDTNKKKD